MKSDVVKRLKARFKAMPWHYKLRVKLKVRMWFWQKNIEHYWNWCTSKDYRLRYGNCTYYCDACWKFDWPNVDSYCRTNPKCTVRKAGVYHIDI